MELQRYGIRQIYIGHPSQYAQIYWWAIGRPCIAIKLDRNGYLHISWYDDKCVAGRFCAFSPRQVVDALPKSSPSAFYKANQICGKSMEKVGYYGHCPTHACPIDAHWWYSPGGIISGVTFTYYCCYVVEWCLLGVDLYYIDLSTSGITLIEYVSMSVTYDKNAPY